MISEERLRAALERWEPFRANVESARDAADFARELLDLKTQPPRAAPERRVGW